jgi:enamine deaminase RidA (YjgF/YER057c/UK114 family)
VAEDARVRDRDLAREDAEVGAADPDGADADERVAGLGVGIAGLAELDPLRAGEDGGSQEVPPCIGSCRIQDAVPPNGADPAPGRSGGPGRRRPMERHNPPGVAGPFASYSHGVELRSPARVLYGAGQTGVEADGQVGDGIEAQAELVWRNIRAVLAAADMGIEDIVQLTMYLVDRDDYPAARRVREEALGDHRPASTLLYVSGLSNPAWRIEIDFVAAVE